MNSSTGMRSTKVTGMKKRNCGTFAPVRIFSGNLVLQEERISQEEREMNLIQNSFSLTVLV